MKRIIGGKVYNTETATFVCDVSPPHTGRSDFRYEDTGLYRTRKGAFFLAGEGGPMSRWSQSSGQNSWTGGKGIEAISTDEAKALVEQHGSARDWVECFGEPEEA